MCLAAAGGLNTIFISSVAPRLPFNLPKKSSRNRIGPHNYEILSLLICHLLGDAHAQKDKRGYGTSIRFYYSAENPEYVIFILAPPFINF